MRRPAQRFRLLLAALAAIQVAAPSMAALADAVCAMDAQWVGVHVEDPARDRDHPPHPDDCIFCRFLAQRAVAPQSGVPDQIVFVVAVAAVARPYCSHYAATSHLPDSRAPPLG